MRAPALSSHPSARGLRAATWLPALVLTAACGGEEQVPPEARSALGDPQAGARVIADIGCGMCHAIPGIAGARGGVGPDLAGFGTRRYFAGSQPNEPARLLQWILDPPSLSPSTAMPRMPIAPGQARDVVAYLYTLR